MERHMEEHGKTLYYITWKTKDGDHEEAYRKYGEAIRRFHRLSDSGTTKSVRLFQYTSSCKIIQQN